MRKTIPLILLLVLSGIASALQVEAQEPSGAWDNRYSYTVDHEDGTHTSTFSIGPQVFWDGSGWQELKFEDLGNGYLLENSMITAYIYDWYTVFYDPDNQRVAVDDERWIVEVYNEKTKNWREVDLYAPSLSYSNNATHLTVTRSFDCYEGLFNVTYILWQGGRLKHDVVFTSRIEGDNQFRVTMKLTGIYSDKVKHSGGVETITSERHVVSPFFVFGEDDNNLVFSEYLWKLGEINETTGEWSPTTLRDVVLGTSAQGSKMDIIIGNYVLAENEVLLIDPDSDTFYAEPISYYIAHKDYFYPPTTETKESGSSYITQGQSLTSFLLDHLSDANGTVIEWDSQYPDENQHYDKVDESSSDGNTTYIASSTVGDVDMFSVTNVSEIPYDWYYVSAKGYIQTLGGSGTVRLLIKTHGEVYEGNIETLSTTSFYSEYHTWYDNPFTSLPWTTEELNDLEVGVKVESCPGGCEIRATRVYAAIARKGYNVYRSYFSFDTSPLNDSAVITDAVLSLNLEVEYASTDFNVIVYSGQDQWTGIPTLGWDDCSSNEGIWGNPNAMTKDTYYNMSIGTESITKTGKTQFRARSEKEGTKPTVGEWCNVHGYSDTGYEPKLYIMWTVGGEEQEYYCFVSQSLSMVSNSYRTWSLSRSLAQSLTLSSVTNRACGFNRLASQSLTFTSNAFSELLQLIKRAASLGVTMTANTIRNCSFIRMTSQGISTSFNGYAHRTITRILTQGISFTANAMGKISSFIKRTVSLSISLTTNAYGEWSHQLWRLLDIVVKTLAGEPMENAVISAWQLNGTENFGAITDEEGYIPTQNLTKGNYTILATKEGYLTNNTLIQFLQDKILEIRLMSAEEGILIQTSPEVLGLFLLSIVMQIIYFALLYSDRQPVLTFIVGPLTSLTWYTTAQTILVINQTVGVPISYLLYLFSTLNIIPIFGIVYSIMAPKEE